MSEQTNDFYLRLENFEGPFDLLLQLIARRKLDVTEVALSQVTDEFLSYVKTFSSVDLDKTSSFLVVAATLLDLKTARLLPSGEVDDVEDLALLEARDLLFSRLLQYRAFKQVASWLQAHIQREELVFGRVGVLEEPYRGALGPVEIPGGAARLAKLATRILSQPEIAIVPFEHLHLPMVSVHEQADILVARLRRHHQLTFRELTTRVDRLTTVARFLAVLELYRSGAIAFEQLGPFAELTLRWVGGDEAVQISDEYDAQTPQEES